MTNDLKHTPLIHAHIRLGAKLVPFGGWQMPVQYSGIIDEHNTVRTLAGLFDVSHMGEFEIKGPKAQKFINKLITNDLGKLKAGQALYTPMCYENGGIVDDLLVYCLENEHYWMVVNAGNIDNDWEWANKHLLPDVELTNISQEIAQIALQGPKSEKILQTITKINLADIKYFRFEKGLVGDLECLVSRTGYTGEDGFELYAKKQDAEKLWELIMTAGKDEGLLPIGLGARDTLRFEAKLPLYGHELSAEINPIEAGLNYFIAWEKEDFIGREALLKIKEEGVKRKLVGFEMLDRGIARAEYPVTKNGVEIGFVTSGSFAPTINKNLGLALINVDEAFMDNTIEIIIRGKAFKGKIIKTPFYKKEAK